MLSNTHFSMAVHVLSALALRDGEALGSEHLAMTVGTNASFLRRLIGRLKEAGLVETQLGKGGGARLARKPSKISLRDVYQATVTDPALNSHACDDSSECPVAAGMGPALEGLNRRIEEAVQAELKQLTIADFLEHHLGIRS